MINLVKTTLKFKDKYEALRLHIYAIAAEEGIVLSPADISVAVEIYKSGYDKDFFTRCVEARYFKSIQTVRNSVAKLTKAGILDKKRGARWIKERIIPFDKNSDFVFTYNVIYDIKVPKRPVPKSTPEFTRAESASR
jgi:hypothetical protein